MIRLGPDDEANKGNSFGNRHVAPLMVYRSIRNGIRLRPETRTKVDCAANKGTIYRWPNDEAEDGLRPSAVVCLCPDDETKGRPRQSRGIRLRPGDDAEGGSRSPEGDLPSVDENGGGPPLDDTDHCFIRLASHH